MKLRIFHQQQLITNGIRNKKIIRSSELSSQFIIANSFNLKLFKAESIEDLTEEQFKVMSAFYLEQRRRENDSSSTSSSNKTVRITSV
jgi:hypothetical protein